MPNPQTTTLGPGYGSIANVRLLSGVSTAAVPDADLTTLLQNASRQLHRDISVRANHLVVFSLNTPSTRFVCPTGYAYFADSNIDSAIDTLDVHLYFAKRDPTSGQLLFASTGTVTVEDAERGIVTSTTACPSDYTPYVDADFYYRPIDLQDAALAAEYLTAHYAFLRQKGPGQTTYADLTGIGVHDEVHRVKGFEVQRTKYWDQYQMIVRSLRGGVGVVV